MSAADLVEARPAAPVRSPQRGASGRLIRSELRLIFQRRRNQAVLAVLAAVPVLIALAVRLAAPGDGEGPPFVARITGNGLFVALAAVTVSIPLFLPLAVSVVSGDSIAAEANAGTLRYLLVVPVSRTKVVVVKYVGVLVYCAAAALLVAGVGALVGLLLFPIGPVTLLSGTQIGYGAGLVRLLLVAGYVTAAMAVIGAIGLFVSTLTEVPVAATAATAVVAVAAQILDSVPQLAPIGPYLFSHWWFYFGDLLRDPMETAGVLHGLGVFAVWIALFGGAAWWRFSRKDVTS
jgi:ABC-2 type transport system permease protein